MGAPKVSSAICTISMARTTPAQNPRGLSRSTRFVFTGLSFGRTSERSRAVVVTPQVYLVHPFKWVKVNQFRCSQSACIAANFIDIRCDLAAKIKTFVWYKLELAACASGVSAIALQRGQPFGIFAVSRAVLLAISRDAATALMGAFFCISRHSILLGVLPARMLRDDGALRCLTAALD